MVFTMPTVRPGQPAPAGAPQRTTFRPPWVKEGPPALPMPSSAPWMRSRDNRASKDDGQPTAISQELQNARDRLNAVETTAAASASKPPEPSPARRLSKITIIPSRPSAEPLTQAEVAAKQKEVNSKPIRDEPQPRQRAEPKEAAVKEKTQDANVATKPAGPRVRKVPTETAKEEISIKTTAIKKDQPKEESAKPPAAKKESPKEPPAAKKIPPKEEPVKVTTVKTETSSCPPPPPAPPGPPMPPPPPPLMPRPGDAPPLTAAKVEKIEALKSRPRRRPDWGTMMKEIESNRKLNHVVCNDRSAPLLATPIKVKEQFMYESEKPNVHNILLDQIQSGVHLKPVKCNDRSRPILDGLRKFRRQMTIEEQIHKAEAEPVTAEADELDDIDRVRDDLQSTKQMLALELRNREAVERENKKLLARLLNLEVEMESQKAAQHKDQNPQSQRIEEEKETRKLKGQLNEAQQLAEEMENKYHETTTQLDLARGEIEDLQRKNQIMEKRLANYASRRDSDQQPLTKQPSAKRLVSTKSNNAIDVKAEPGKPQEDEESEYEEVTDTESEEESTEDEADKEALQEKRTTRELKMLVTKLKTFKDKEEMARKERVSLKEQVKKLSKSLDEEKKKYKILQCEVDSMATSMANVLKAGDDEGSDEEEEESESESESESDSEESDDESEGDLSPDSPAEALKNNLNSRVKRHENVLAVLKKGNYMLKTNVDRMKDDLFRQKEMAITLQEDLNSVLAELG